MNGDFGGAYSENDVMNFDRRNGGHEGDGRGDLDDGVEKRLAKVNAGCAGEVLVGEVDDDLEVGAGEGAEDGRIDIIKLHLLHAVRFQELHHKRCRGEVVHNNVPASAENKKINN